MTRLYFAYGSNMDRQQMSERCPGNKWIGIGKLVNHHLVFPRQSRRRNCGVASIEFINSEEVWGVVFELSEEDVLKLNESEGFDPSRESDKNSYNPIEIFVDLKDGKQLNCYTYVAVPQTGTYLPNSSYIGQIVKGARQNLLPDVYISTLTHLPVQP